MDIKTHKNKHLNQHAHCLGKSSDCEDFDKNNALLGSLQKDFHSLNVIHWAVQLHQAQSVLSVPNLIPLLTVSSHQGPQGYGNVALRWNTALLHSG